MRRIALINQKGGVGKTTTVANLGAGLARAGKRVVVVDLDPQANLTLHLGVEVAEGEPTSYRVLTGESSFGAALCSTTTEGLRLLPTDIDLSGAEMELSTTPGRERLLRQAVQTWRTEHAEKNDGAEPADYLLYDCPPSLGLLSLNALAAADEVYLVVQTHFLALQGMSKLVEIIDLVRHELHPELELTGIVPSMYDSRMRLAREVLAELRRYFPSQVFRAPIRSNVKLAESPSFGKTIFEYAPSSVGARDFAALADEVLSREASPEVETEDEGEEGCNKDPAKGALKASPPASASPAPAPAKASRPSPKGAAPRAPAVAGESPPAVVRPQPPRAVPAPDASGQTST